MTLDSDLAARRALNRMLRDWGLLEDDDQLWRQIPKISLTVDQCMTLSGVIKERETWDNRKRPRLT